MASPNVRVIVEFPAGMQKLPKKQADQLKELFRTQLANVIQAKDVESLAFLEFENVSSPPVGAAGGGSSKARKAGSKKGVKKGGAKKSSK